MSFEFSAATKQLIRDFIAGFFESEHYQVTDVSSPEVMGRVLGYEPLFGKARDEVRAVRRELKFGLTKGYEIRRRVETALVPFIREIMDELVEKGVLEKDVVNEVTFLEKDGKTISPPSLDFPIGSTIYYVPWLSALQPDGALAPAVSIDDHEDGLLFLSDHRVQIVASKESGLILGFIGKLVSEEDGSYTVRVINGEEHALINFKISAVANIIAGRTKEGEPALIGTNGSVGVIHLKIGGES